MAAGGSGAQPSGGAASRAAAFKEEFGEMLEVLWSAVDKDGSESIERAELGAIVRQANGNKPVPPAALDQLMAQMDADNSGTIDKGEFMSTMAEWLGSSRSGAKRTRQLFNDGAAAAGAGAGQDDEEDQRLEETASNRRRLHGEFRSFLLQFHTEDMDAQMIGQLAAQSVDEDTRFCNLQAMDASNIRERAVADRAKSLADLQKMLRDGDERAKMEAIKAGLASADLAQRSLSLDRLDILIGAAQYWRTGSCDNTVRAYVRRGYENFRSHGMLEPLVAMLNPSATATPPAAGSPAATRFAPVVSLQQRALGLLRLYLQGPKLPHMPSDDAFHPDHVWQVAKRALTAARPQGPSGPTALEWVLQLASKCPEHAIRAAAFRLLAVIAMKDGPDCPINFREGLLSKYKLAQVCLARLSCTRFVEPPLNRSAICECLAILCGESHGPVGPQSMDARLFSLMNGPAVGLALGSELSRPIPSGLPPSQLANILEGKAHALNGLSHIAHMFPAQEAFFVSLCQLTRLVQQAFLAPASELRLQAVAEVTMRSCLRLFTFKMQPKAGDHMAVVAAASIFSQPAVNFIKSKYPGAIDKSRRMIAAVGPGGLLRSVLVPLLRTHNSTPLRLMVLQLLSIMADVPPSDDLNFLQAIVTEPGLMQAIVATITERPVLVARCCRILRRLCQGGRTSAAAVVHCIQPLEVALKSHFEEKDDEMEAVLGVTDPTFHTGLADGVFRTYLALLGASSELASAGARNPVASKCGHVVSACRHVLERVHVENLRLAATPPVRRFTEGERLVALIMQVLTAVGTVCQAGEPAFEQAKQTMAGQATAQRQLDALRQRVQSSKSAVELATLRDHGIIPESEQGRLVMQMLAAQPAVCTAISKADSHITVEFRATPKQSFQTLLSIVEAKLHIAEGGVQLFAFDDSNMNGHRERREFPVEDDASLRRAWEVRDRHGWAGLKLLAQRRDGRRFYVPRAARSAGEFIQQMRGSVAGGLDKSVLAGMVGMFKARNMEELTFADFCQQMQAHFGGLPQGLLSALFKGFDRDNSGTISLEELAMGVGVLQSPRANREMQLRFAFQAIDTDNSGTISERELARALEFLGNLPKAAATQRAAQIMVAVDRDGDRELNFPEFHAAMAACPEVLTGLLGISANNEVGMSD